MLHSSRKTSSLRTLATALTLTSALLVNVGCKKNGAATTEPATTATENAAQTPDISRIVSINGAMTEILSEFGLLQNIVGVDVSSTYPVEVTQYPQVGYYRNLSDEGILGLNPSIIIGEEEAGPTAVVDRLQKSGVPVHLIAFEISLKGAVQRIHDVANAVGLPEKGNELVARIEQELDDAAKVPGPNNETPPRILGVYARGAGLSLVAGHTTPYDVVIQLAGGINATAVFEGFQPLTPEAVATSNADVILITQGGLAALGGPDGLFALNGIAETPAGKNRRVLVYDDLLLTGLGPRLPQLIADMRAQLHTLFPQPAPADAPAPDEAMPE